MRVAVTGGSGEVGQYVVADLQQQGYTVRNVDRRAPPTPGGEYVAADLAEPEAVRGALAGCEAVVHLAALPNPNVGPPADVFRINVLGTRHVLDAAVQLGIRRLVLASSVNVVGLMFNRTVQLDYLPLDEAHPCRPDEVYGLSKQVGELVADAAARREPELRIASLRYSRVVPAAGWDAWLAAGRARPAWAPRLLWAGVTAEEAARAARLALTADFRGHETFFITAAENLAGRPGGELAAEFFPGVPWRGAAAGPAALISPAKAERLLGWRHAPLFPA